MKVGIIQPGIYSDGQVIYVTCPECGTESGDFGPGILCEECHEGILPTSDGLPPEIKAAWGIDQEPPGKPSRELLRL